MTSDEEARHLAALDKIRIRYDMGDGPYGRDSIAVLLKEIAILSERLAARGVSRRMPTFQAGAKCYSCGGPATLLVRDVGMSHVMDIYVCADHRRGATVLAVIEEEDSVTEETKDQEPQQPPRIKTQDIKPPQRKDVRPEDGQ